MYRVGDFVYFESSSSKPYNVRKIEELTKTGNGEVEVKVKCFYRRRDLSEALIALADKHQRALESSDEDNDRDALTDKQKEELKHRELFSSRQQEILPATHIRGKCSVTLLIETESVLSYLNKDDTFFYCLVLDPSQRTLLADHGKIRVGSKFQVNVPSNMGEMDKAKRPDELETMIWSPENSLSDKEIDQFLITSRSVGTFARALECESSIKPASLHMNAAAASRDITIFYAMDSLHQNNYELCRALNSLLPTTGPVICKDEMEEWTASEANLFEEALEKYGKDFNDIRKDFLPWKSLKNIIEYYYMWKTTDKYALQKRVKVGEAETKLVQVNVPTNQKSHKGSSIETINTCESCRITGQGQWHSWGPTQRQCKLCQSCWTYWKRYGGLPIASKNGEVDLVFTKSDSICEDDKRSEAMSDISDFPHRCHYVGCAEFFEHKAHLARHYANVHNVVVKAGSFKPLTKLQTAFFLTTTPLIRLARRICRDVISIRHAARAPFCSINVKAIQEECKLVLSAMETNNDTPLLRNRDRDSVVDIASKLWWNRKTPSTKH